jgi:hypothetical protein
MALPGKLIFEPEVLIMTTNLCFWLALVGQTIILFFLWRSRKVPSVFKLLALLVFSFKFCFYNLLIWIDISLINLWETLHVHVCCPWLYG